MDIESALSQQRPFTSSCEKTMVNLMYTHNYIMERMSHFFGGFDLTMKQYNILRILRGADAPISTATIRDRMVDRMSDVSRIADRMERKNLIVKKSCAADKRKVDIEISQKGMSLLEKIEHPLYELQQALIPIDQGQMIQLNDLLDHIRIDK